MSPAAETLPPAAAPAAPPVQAVRWGLRELVEVTKPRLATLSVCTALAGYAAARPEWSWPVVLAVWLGTSLAAGGVIALNQWAERGLDAKMARTAARPLPAGRLPPAAALVWGLLLCAAGDALLALGTHPLAGALALLTQLLYLGLYTPLKRVTPWNTEVGAVPGALPPLLGWAAATGEIGPTAWALGWLLLLWQMPHFMAIAWLYREDYARAGFRMVTVLDPAGAVAARRAVAYTLPLVLLGPACAVTGLTGWMFGLVAPLATVLLLLWPAVRMLAAEGRPAAARRLFFGSILHLPLVLGAFVADAYL